MLIVRAADAGHGTAEGRHLSLCAARLDIWCVCGRFVVHLDARSAAHFGVELAEPWGPYYNVAPTQTVAVVVGVDGRRERRFMRWGLIPSWASDPAIGNRMINARAESADEGW